MLKLVPSSGGSLKPLLFWLGREACETRDAYHLHKPPEWKSSAETHNYKIWRAGRTAH